MKITVEGTAKEIVDLVLAVQGQPREIAAPLTVIRDALIAALSEGTHDNDEAMSIETEEEKNTTYTVEDINSLGYPRSVKMSFELLYRDWCIFEKSELFQNLTSYLAELQMQRSPNVLQEKQD